MDDVLAGRLSRLPAVHGLADAIDGGHRRARMPVVGRIEDARVWLGARTIAARTRSPVAAAVQGLGL